MLTINLIPKYYFERRQVRRLMALFGILWAAVVVVMVLSAWAIQNNITQANDQLAQVEPVAQQVEQLQKQAGDLRAEVKPITDKITYIKAVMDYNTAIVPLLLELSKYTYKTIQYTSVTPQPPSSLTITGWAPSIMDAGRYLLGLYRATGLFTAVSFKGVPGYGTGSSAGEAATGAAGSAPQSGRLGFSFTATCTLAKPISPPSYTSSGAGGGAPGVPGAPGGLPGSPAPPGVPAAP